MKILTVGTSPYRLTANGRFHADLMRYLLINYEVESAVFDHDTSYFMSDIKDNTYRYDGICVLHPLDIDMNKRARKVLKIVGDYNPDIILTIGDYYENYFVGQIRKMYPKLRWVSALSISNIPTNIDSYNDIDYVDCSIVDNNKALIPLPDITYCPIGIDIDDFYANNSLSNRFRIMWSGKNKSTSGVDAFIYSIRILRDRGIDVDVYLHTNIHDTGYFDIKKIIEYHCVSDLVSLPEKFSSCNEGISNDELRKEYCSSSIFVSTDYGSRLRCSVLESMSCGCVPVVPENSDLPIDIKDKISFASVSRLNHRLEIEYIPDPNKLSDTIESLYMSWAYQRSQYMKYRNECIKIAGRYSRNRTVIQVEGLIERSLAQSDLLMSVENFEGKKEFVKTTR